MSKVGAYQNCVTELMQLLGPYAGQTNVMAEGTSAGGTTWPDGGNNQMLFQSDTAFEFGGSGLPAIGGLFFVSNSARLFSEYQAETVMEAMNSAEKAIPEGAVEWSDEVVLIGPDICDIRKNSPYARLAIVRVDETKLGEGKELYKDIRKIEYARYHVNPLGFMVRISAMSHKEAVRIGKDAVHKGISFGDIGPMYVQEYHKHPAVISVKTVFITDPEFPYRELAKLCGKSEDITKTLDHLLTKVKMDCDTCGLKVICDEVEQLL